MDERGWDDIGYNFILCNDKEDQQQIYMGRGWTYIGAHCKGYNNESLGIGIAGNYTGIKSLNVFKSLIQCGIMQNYIMKNFTLIRYDPSSKAYEYYLQYLRNDTDLQYNNQASDQTVSCQ
ncbi:unnamed protein product [Rotaria sordida]|uniref:Peptidoglycan recognition protein family domain-containing protein n=2 Tax=Rotaria sordida TaxID=392033 RepID=A0A815DP52_9BILA|nr:unnamed protein product [Rotaria sordida]